MQQITKKKLNKLKQIQQIEHNLCVLLFQHIWDIHNIFEISPPSIYEAEDQGTKQTGNKYHQESSQYIFWLEEIQKVTQHIFIFDLEGFSLGMATHTPTLDILQRLISIYEGLSKYLIW